jgi:hypothetical protein
MLRKLPPDGQTAIRKFPGIQNKGGVTGIVSFLQPTSLASRMMGRGERSARRVAWESWQPAKWPGTEFPLCNARSTEVKKFPAMSVNSS